MYGFFKYKNALLLKGVYGENTEMKSKIAFN